MRNLIVIPFVKGGLVGVVWITTLWFLWLVLYMSAVPMNGLGTLILIMLVSAGAVYILKKIGSKRPVLTLALSYGLMFLLAIPLVGWLLTRSPDYWGGIILLQLLLAAVAFGTANHLVTKKFS